MSTALILILAALLDATLGEPKWLWDRMPHPAVLMGRAVAWCDRRMNHGTARRLQGVLAMLALGIAALCLGWALGALGWVVEVVVGWHE